MKLITYLTKLFAGQFGLIVKIELIGLIGFISLVSHPLLSQELAQVQTVVLQKWGFERTEQFEGLITFKRLHHLEASHYVICEGDTDLINCYRACEQISLGKSVEQAILCNDIKDQYFSYLIFTYHDFMGTAIVKGYCNKAFQKHLEASWQGDGLLCTQNLEDCLWPISETDRNKFGSICDPGNVFIILKDQDAVIQYANILNQLR